MAKYMVPADQQTKLLIHLCKELDDEFLSRWRRNEDLWAKFIGKLHAAGFRGKTGLQVTTKWNDLKKKYRKAKVNNRSTGWARKNFPFEDEMDDVLSGVIAAEYIDDWDLYHRMMGRSTAERTRSGTCPPTKDGGTIGNTPVRGA